MHESKFIQIIFFISPLFYFQTKHHEGKLKTILSSHFLSSPYFLSSHFSTPPTKFAIATQVPRTWVPCAGRAKVEKLSTWTSSLKTTKNNPNRNHEVQTHKEMNIKPIKKWRSNPWRRNNKPKQKSRTTKIKPTKKQRSNQQRRNNRSQWRRNNKGSRKIKPWRPNPNNEDQIQTTKIKFNVSFLIEWKLIYKLCS